MVEILESGIDTGDVIKADTIDVLYVVGEATHRFLYNRSFITAASNSAGLTMGRMTG